MTGSDLVLFVRTAAHLQPGQIAQRARLRAQRQALRRFPATAAGCWPALTPRQPRAGRPGSFPSTHGSGGTGPDFRGCGKAAPNCSG